MEKVFFTKPARPAVLIKRLNRFAARVHEARGNELTVHVPNSGRLEELLCPGAEVVVTGDYQDPRKTRADLTLARTPGGQDWVCIDARMPGKLLEASLASFLDLFALGEWTVIGREPPFGQGRFDLLLGRGEQRCLVETKCVTLVQDQVALFPDAPTLRGRRHMEELVEARKYGYEAAVFFIVQRQDATMFAPHDAMDPAFGQALRFAVAHGVHVYACACRVDPEGMELDRALPVNLSQKNLR